MLSYISVLTAYFKSLIRDEEGASAVEYGLILGLIAVAIIVVLGLIGGNLDAKFDSVCAAVKGSAC